MARAHSYWGPEPGPLLGSVQIRRDGKHEIASASWGTTGGACASTAGFLNLCRLPFRETKPG